MTDLFPILDISYISEKYTSFDEWNDETFRNDPKIQTLAQELSNGFETWGFLYVKGHGISQELIDKTFEYGMQFFTKSHEEKMKFKRSRGKILGYLPSYGEVFDESKPEDMKEAFDFAPRSDLSKNLANVMPDQVNAFSHFYEQCQMIVLKLLHLLALALNVDCQHFLRFHQSIGKSDANSSTLRLLFYPPIHSQVTTDHRRCRDHTDYGTITLLFQDGAGGLEVLSPSGNFIKAVPIPGTIVINVGDILQTWSGGKFKATVHKVIIPTTSEKLNTARHSMAFFAHPDFDVIVEHTDEDGIIQKNQVYTHIKAKNDKTIVLE